METSGSIDLLHDAPFITGLAGAERRRLASFTRLVDAERDEILLHEGEPTPYLAIVTTGRVALRMRLPGRGPVTIATVEPGDIVGWSAVVAPYRATSTAVTVEPTRMIAFDGPQLRQALEADEDLAAALYPRILRSVARRLEGTRLQLLDLFGKPEDAAW